MLHWFISNEFNLGQVLVAPITPAVEITVPMVDPLNAIPNQTNILDQIAEIESTLMADDDVWSEVEEITDDIIVPIQEPDVIEYTDPAGNTFEAIDFHNAVTAEEVIEEEVVVVAPERVKFSVDNTEEPELDFDLNFEDDSENNSDQFFL
jgi:hypothetical protein